MSERRDDAQRRGGSKPAPGRREGGGGARDRGRRDVPGRGGSRDAPPANGRQTRPDAPRAEEPAIDEDVTGAELDSEVRAELDGLSGGAAKMVSRHLVMAGRLLDDDPEAAYAHAMTARRRASRIGLIREAVGIAAYRAERYAEALAELRAARRMTGSAEYLPMMADCERGLGRPERALDLASDPAVTGLDTAGRMEMLIVAAGARRDLGQHAAAAALLQVPELRAKDQADWVARLRYGYADALEAAGRENEARRWFSLAAEADVYDETDAEVRAMGLA